LTGGSVLGDTIWSVSALGATLIDGCNARIVGKTLLLLDRLLGSGQVLLEGDLFGHFIEIGIGRFEIGMKGVELDNGDRSVKTVYFCVFNVMALKRRPSVAPALHLPRCIVVLQQYYHACNPKAIRRYYNDCGLHMLG